MKINELLTGRSEDHLGNYRDARLHHEVIPKLQLLRKSAAFAGHELAIASSFRSFQQQLLIWNQKALGKRTLLDNDENIVDPTTLSPTQLLFTILRWSALPGTSRHHWGSDFDIYDRAALPPNYQLQLTQHEADHLFGDFHKWLDHNLEDFNFYRPFYCDGGGVAPEPWHISYAPVANPLSNQLTIELVAQTIEQTDIVLKHEILHNLDQIFERFICLT